MAAPTERVFVTGIGMVTPFGIGHEAYWEGVLSARSVARRIDTFDVTGHPSPFACPVDDSRFDPAPFVTNRKSLKLMGRATRFASVAATLALRHANLAVGAEDPGRFAVVHGSGGVGLHDLDHARALLALTTDLTEKGCEEDLVEAATRHLNPLLPLMMLPNITAAHLAIEHGFRGENHTVCTACTSGTQAIGAALRLLRDRKADVALAGGSDAMINPMGLIGFGMLGVLSRRADDPARAARPFDRNRDGFVMGEGSAMLVLETERHALSREAELLVEIVGYGGCSDAFRVTDEREDGGGCVDAIRRTLRDGGLRPGDVDYVNAHGTGTRMNDRTEVRAIHEVFGPHARRLAVSSTKSQIGHLIAAAGAVEAATCVLALRHQVLPPTINYETPDPECDLDVVPNAPREASFRTVLSNSFGFGGQNACLAFRRAA